MVMIDQAVVFDAFEHMTGGMDKQSLPVVGTVYAVNYGHKVFHVAYDVQGVEQRTSFKFCDIGERVKICQ